MMSLFCQGMLYIASKHVLCQFCQDLSHATMISIYKAVVTRCGTLMLQDAYFHADSIEYAHIESVPCFGSMHSQ